MGRIGGAAPHIHKHVHWDKEELVWNASKETYEWKLEIKSHLHFVIIT